MGGVPRWSLGFLDAKQYYKFYELQVRSTTYVVPGKYFIETNDTVKILDMMHTLHTTVATLEQERCTGTLP